MPNLANCALRKLSFAGFFCVFPILFHQTVTVLMYKYSFVHVIICRGFPSSLPSQLLRFIHVLCRRSFLLALTVFTCCFSADVGEPAVGGISAFSTPLSFLAVAVKSKVVL